MSNIDKNNTNEIIKYIKEMENKIDKILNKTEKIESKLNDLVNQNDKISKETERMDLMLHLLKVFIILLKVHFIF